MMTLHVCSSIQAAPILVLGWQDRAMTGTWNLPRLKVFNPPSKTYLPPLLLAVSRPCLWPPSKPKLQ